MRNTVTEKSYHINYGDTKGNMLGLCARVKASSKKEAVQILNEALGEYYELRVSEAEYVHIYFNRDITTRSCDDGDE